MSKDEGDVWRIPVSIEPYKVVEFRFSRKPTKLDLRRLMDYLHAEGEHRDAIDKIEEKHRKEDAAIEAQVASIATFFMGCAAGVAAGSSERRVEVISRRCEEGDSNPHALRR